MRKIIFVDLETTGLSPNIDEVIEIAIVQLNPDWTHKTLINTFVKPSRPIQPFITKINGITNDMVEGFPPFLYFKEEIKNIFKNSVIVGHNIKTFDLKFIYRLFSDNEWDELNILVLDTLYEARSNILADSHKLDHLCSVFDIVSEKSHRAEYDCIRNIEMLKILTSLGKHKSELLSSIINPSVINFDQYSSHFNKPSGETITSKNAIDLINHLQLRYDALITKELLSEFTVCITGECGVDRDEIEYIIKYAGGKCSSNITMKTNLLIFGTEYGSKLTKALDKGIPIISHVFLFEFLTIGKPQIYTEKSHEILSVTSPYKGI